MATDKSLLLGAIPTDIEVQVEGIVERRRRSYYFVRLCVDGQKVSKSTKSKPSSSVLKWKWNTNNQTWFLPLSSVMKVELYRGFKINLRWFERLVGQYETDVVAFLENVAPFDLTDKKGNSFPAKMHIVLSPNSGSGDNVKEFLDKVDADVSRLSSNDAVAGTVSALGVVLQLTKTIMDKLSEAHPILKASWSIVSSLYQAVRETDIQDESIRKLATTLREILGITKAIPNLKEIPDTTNVIKEINRQSLEVAALIQEYTKLHFAVRTVRISVDLKARIEECRDKWIVLKDKLSLRIAVDTNIRVQRIEDRQLADKIHKWLSPPDSSRNRNEAHGKRQDDTCSWFLEGERFLKWQENPGFLWVKGKPGCGKSILCSSIIDKLPQPTQSLGIAYFFFDGRDGQTELQLHNKLIRSLISQLSDTRHGGIPVKLKELHEKCGDQQPLDDQLQDTLRHILSGLSDAYVVIDALDECNDRQKTLDWVNELVTHTDRNMGRRFHIVVTSRPEPDIEAVFGVLDEHSVDVGEADANEDITTYLKHQMGLQFQKYDETTRNEMERSLRARAEGSFRWVALQLAELAKCSSRDEITKQLAELPKGLDEIYGRILAKIDEKHRADARTFLSWLAFSKRPMEIVEIAETITVDYALEDSPVFNSSKRYIDPRHVLVRCSSLVTESGGTLKLSHFSVKEYLLSNHIEKYFSISEKAAHVKISEISVAYLLQFDNFTPLTEAMLASSPLARYAAWHWIDHATFEGIDPAPLKLILQLFTTESAAFANWIRIYDIDDYDMRQDFSKAEVPSPLYYASLAGLQQVSAHLLENGAEVNLQGGRYGNALQAASSEGHEVIVKLLIEKGADVNAQGGLYGNALQAASSAGDEVIVKLLIENGADVDAQGGFYDNALQAASSEGHEVIVKLLIEKGADVNAQGGLYGNALQAASSAGDEVIVKLLIEKGAGVNAQGGLYGNALQAAVIVKLLIENGADVDAWGGFYDNALQAASSGGHEVIVKLLIEKGADVNAQGGRYGNALQVASLAGREVIVKLLIEKGADVNAQGGEYGNALQGASSKGHEVIVKLLIEKGADLNAQGGGDGSALQVASVRGHEVIVKLLIEKGADVNCDATSPTIGVKEDS